MKEGSRANALLVELLLVIFFFMIAAAILVQVFADAKLKSRTANAYNETMLEAQNIAEDLYAAKDPDAVLNGYGFTAQDGGWVLDKDEYSLKITVREEETDQHREAEDTDPRRRRQEEVVDITAPRREERAGMSRPAEEDTATGTNRRRREIRADAALFLQQ